VKLTSYSSSDWTLDITDPAVNAVEGWQYARTFQDADDTWTAEPSPQLDRLLSGSGTLSVGMSTPGRGSSQASTPASVGSQKWVRRRRWVRVMRRRLDVPALPFQQPDGAMYHLDATGGLIPVELSEHRYSADGDGEELGFMASSGFSSARDYVARARYLAGTPHPDAETSGPVDPVDLRRAIIKLERATSELRQGVLREFAVDFHPDLILKNCLQGTMSLIERRKAKFC
jgi:hypothetical protein